MRFLPGKAVRELRRKRDAFCKGASGSWAAKAHSYMITVNCLFPRLKIPHSGHLGVRVGNWVGALIKSLASCFADCAFVLLSTLRVAARGLIRWIDGLDFRVAQSGKGAGKEREQWA